MTSGESDWRIRLAIWYRLLWISLAPLATILLHFTTQLVFVFDYEQEALLRVRELFRGNMCPYHSEMRGIKMISYVVSINA